MFDTLNQQTAQAISAAENLVEQLKQQLKQAQDTLNSLYQQQQLEQTAQGTVKTALDMAHKAYHALDAAYPNNPEAIEEFEQAFLSLRNRHRIDFGVSAQSNAEFEHPLPTVDKEDDFIDVTPLAVSEVEPQTTPSNSNSNGNGHHTSTQLSDHSTQSADLPYLLPVAEPELIDPSTEILTIDELKVLPRDTLQTLCDRFNQPKNGNRLHIAKRLAGKVIRRDVTSPEPKLEF
ncbi:MULTISPECIES: hypothetical protein [unclassified Coleofasciculus]|uniref:hypothetical protein n=1 Tax=unclassified Coleofasciculus TaxID=2692782 RepID=UPI00187F7D17|nr:MULTISPECIES: hypothetical protein [unclassified Coleofasciculus]MBE9128598.1 hypothetical protein [Coleofasciculus sp. LEGE 07081]MBE9150688.1 hypothetical protein [Coleofasciculus sp. LEGE 07092]